MGVGHRGVGVKMMTEAEWHHQACSHDATEVPALPQFLWWTSVFRTSAHIRGPSPKNNSKEPISKGS